MKTKRNIASLIAAGALFLASCSSMFYPKANALDAIKQGMTQEEVTKLLGRPDFRRIDYGLEEWEYRKLFSPLDSDYTTVIVRFEDGRLVYMDSFHASDREPQVPPVPVVQEPVAVVPVQPAYPNAMPDRAFRDFYQKVKREMFKDDQMQLIRAGVEHKLFTCQQCAEMMSLFTFDDDKMQVLRMFARRLVDKENYETILREIDSMFTQDDARKLLGIPSR